MLDKVYSHKNKVGPEECGVWMLHCVSGTKYRHASWIGAPLPDYNRHRPASSHITGPWRTLLPVRWSKLDDRHGHTGPDAVCAWRSGISQRKHVFAKWQGLAAQQMTDHACRPRRQGEAQGALTNIKPQVSIARRVNNGFA